MMDIKNKNIFYSIIMVISLSGMIYSQSTRSLVNDGVDLYKKGKINDAEVNFKKGLTKSPKNFEVNFNLGDAFYKNKRYDEAIDAYQKSLLLSNDKKFKSKVYHNIGNSYLKQKKLDESIEAYKNALKLNPNDEETKYNLSYALQQKKDNKNNKNKDKDKNNKDKNDKNKDKNDPNKDKNKNDKDKNNKDKNKEQNNPQNKDKDKKQNNPEQNPAKDKKNKISKEQAKQILNALMNNEKLLQKKLRKKKGKVVKTEKDW